MDDEGFLPDAVDGKFDRMQNTLCRDVDVAAFSIEGEGHGDDRFQRIALSAASG